MQAKRRFWSIAFFGLLLGLLLLNPAVALAAGSTIEFVTFRLDSPATGQSTWYYKVTSAARPAISHVTFALNLGCLQVVSAGTWNGTDLNALNPGGGNPVVGTDATTGLTGVKFDAGFAGREVRYYYFTVNGNYAPEPIAAVAKSGTELENFTVTGPSPTCAPAGNPAIDITKSPDLQQVVAGGTATFTIRVQNTGDVPLSNVAVTDPLAPNCNRAIGALAVGAFTEYTCSVIANADFTNVASVSGQDAIGRVVQDSDPANVDVIHPAIDINKTPDAQQVVTGGTATFTIRVQNTGDVDLSNVVVNDPLAPNCDRTIGALAVGAVVEYTCSVTVTADFTNVATVTGQAPNGAPVQDSDPADVDAINPAITINKTPDQQTVLAGFAVTFNIAVQNTGDVPLSNVTVTDALAPACNKAIGALAVGASHTYACTVSNVTADFVNVAVVTGQAPNGATVTDDDPAAVTVIQPATLGDFVWEDLNGNGVQDAGEAGIANVTVKLYDCSNNLVSSTTTNASGLYQFSVAPGSYAIQIVAPSGYLFSAPNQGGNDATDSDADPTTGLIPCVTVASGAVNNTLDAGLRLATGKLTPTGTECAAYTDGSAANLNAVSYQTKGSTISTVSSPGAFIYFSRVSANSAGNLVVEIRQTKPSGISKYFGINEGPKLYSLNCARVDNLTISENLATGVVTITGSGLTPGSVYVLYQKYSSNSLVGATVADRRATYNYGFATFQGGALVDFDAEGLNVAPAASSAASEAVSVFMPLALR